MSKNYTSNITTDPAVLRRMERTDYLYFEDKAFVFPILDMVNMFLAIVLIIYMLGRKESRCNPIGWTMSVISLGIVLLHFVLLIRDLPLDPSYHFSYFLFLLKIGSFTLYVFTMVPLAVAFYLRSVRKWELCRRAGIIGIIAVLSFCLVNVVICLAIGLRQRKGYNRIYFLEKLYIRWKTENILMVVVMILLILLLSLGIRNNKRHARFNEQPPNVDDSSHESTGKRWRKRIIATVMLGVLHIAVTTVHDSLHYYEYMYPSLHRYLVFHACHVAIYLSTTLVWILPAFLLELGCLK